MLKAGAAQVEITPDPGVWLTGYASRTQPATGTHDPLFARALYLESGATRAALGVADIIGFDDHLVERIRQGAAAADLHPSHVMLAATHTHSAPSIRCLHRMAPVDPQAMERAAQGMIGAIVTAAKGADNAAIGAGCTTGSIGVNRRQRAPQGHIVMQPNLAGPIDRQVGVLRVEGEAAPICVMLNHACHGVVLDADNLLYSADWPGAAARTVRDALRAGVAMVTNGACGDINPAERGSFEAMERQGAAIARSGLDILNRIQLSSQVRLDAAARQVELPTRALTPEEAAQTLERTRGDLERARESGNPAAIRACEVVLPWAQEMVDLAAGGAPPQPVITEIQAIAIDDIALVGLPGEVFVEIGMNIRAASPFRDTFVIGYANRSVGYLPTRAAFAEGGYEVEFAHRYYGFPPFTDEVQGIVEGTARELLKSLR
jgi:hypothetical protein